MRAKKCDRCSKFYDVYVKTVTPNELSDDRKLANGLSITNMDDRTTCKWKDFDLCPDCLQEFLKFIGWQEYYPKVEEEKDKPDEKDLCLQSV